MDDLISRKAAYDALMAEPPKWDDSSVWESARCYQWNMDVDVINALPSAQPEIIRCQKCKFASGDSRICMKFGHSPIGELDFCAWAERRTDEEADIS